MAEVVDQLPYPDGQGHREMYPWGSWLDGRAWKLEHLDDFRVKPESFRRAAKQAGAVRGFKVRTRIVGSAVYLQAVREDDDERAAA